MKQNQIVGWLYFRCYGPDGKVNCYARISKTELHECRKKKKYWIRTNGKFSCQIYVSIQQIHNSRPLKELKAIRTLCAAKEDRNYPCNFPCELF